MLPLGLVSSRYTRTSGCLERFRPDFPADAGCFAHGTALRLLAMAHHVASLHLVPRANHFGLAWCSPTESTLVIAQKTQVAFS